jgi:hypothetical protein
MRTWSATVARQVETQVIALGVEVRPAGVPLGVGDARQVDADLGVHPLPQAGAVEGHPWLFRAVHLRQAELGLGVRRAGCADATRHCGAGRSFFCAHETDRRLRSRRCP